MSTIHNIITSTYVEIAIAIALGMALVLSRVAGSMIKKSYLAVTIAPHKSYFEQVLAPLDVIQNTLATLSTDVSELTNEVAYLKGKVDGMQGDKEANDGD